MQERVIELKVLVCGGRNYGDERRVAECLDIVHKRYFIDTIIEGGAYGADRLCKAWAESNGIKVKTFLPNWKKYGKSAGPIRNKEMLSAKPHVLIAFPGNYGTDNMIKQAEAAGIRVWRA